MVTGRRRSRDSSAQLALLGHFVAGTPARSAAEIVGVNRHTATLFYHKLREVIAQRLVCEAPELCGANGLTYKLPAAGVPCDMWISGTASWMYVVTARHTTYPHITRLNNDKLFYFNLIQASPIIKSFLVLFFKKELLSWLRLIAV